MNNAIPTRIYGFLKEHPPFSYLRREDLLSLSEQAVVRYCRPDEVIFKQGEIPRNCIFIVQEGAVHLLREAEPEPILVDECDEGDVFGVRPLLAEEAYALTAKAAEESLLYEISTDGLRQLLENQPKVAWYLAQSFAAGMRNRFSRDKKGRIFSENSQLTDETFHLIEVQSIEHSRKPVTCPPNTNVQAAAKIMQQQRVGSIIVVDEENHPMGILTDRDLRNRIVTGELPLDTLVTEIMSSPVKTVPPSQTVADVQLEMMRHGIHHLALTEDGTSLSPIVGVISEHDLLVVQGNNPAIFIREIRRCTEAGQLRAIRERAERLLRKYLLQEVAINFICNVMSEVNDALIVRAIEICEAQLKWEGLEPPAVKWCWLGLGSEGREEQLLRTDQDNALVFEEVPEADLPKAKDYFLQLAKRVNDMLNDCGFDYCPADMMASNPKWCMPLSGWKAQFSEWILTPTEMNIMLSNIFFDYRPVHGDHSLADELTAHIFEELGKTDLFLALQSKDAMKNPPPLTFFRNFVVEKGGEHKNEFDIKARAMMPLADAARVLILNAREPAVNNTFHRFDRLAELEPKNRELFEQAADAYEILVRYRAMQGLKNQDSGRYFDPSELTKMQRMNLRNCFKPISEVQELLKVRFRLSII